MPKGRSVADIRDLYFRRRARFILKGDQFFVVDQRAPRIITMADWPKGIFLAADGMRTIHEWLGVVSDGLTADQRAEVANSVPTMVEELIREGLIELRESPEPLPFYLALSVSEQDPTEAREAMLRDGFIKAAN